MPALHIVLEGDRAWPDLLDKMDKVIHVTEPFTLAALEGGMTSGKTSVMFRIDLPDGRVVLAETSFALLDTAVRAIRAKYGE